GGGVDHAARARDRAHAELPTIVGEPGRPQRLRPCHSDGAGRTGHQDTWSLPTPRADVAPWAQGISTSVPVVLEASPAGKAVARVRMETGLEIHRAAPNRIPLPTVQSYRPDRNRWGHLYPSGLMPERYVPPPEIEHLRRLTRIRKDLAHHVTLGKNPVRALVTRNLLDSEMTGVADGFGVGGCRSSPASRSRSRSTTEPTWRATWGNRNSSRHPKSPCGWSAPKSRRGGRMFSSRWPSREPGAYLANGIIAEIGDIHRFPDPEQLASYAGLASES
ncbi:transposase, partial [mine drainage metagenome]